MIPPPPVPVPNPLADEPGGGSLRPQLPEDGTAAAASANAAAVAAAADASSSAAAAAAGSNHNDHDGDGGGDASSGGKRKKSRWGPSAAQDQQQPAQGEKGKPAAAKKAPAAASNAAASQSHSKTKSKTATAASINNAGANGRPNRWGSPLVGPHGVLGVPPPPFGPPHPHHHHAHAHGLPPPGFRPPPPPPPGHPAHAAHAAAAHAAHFYYAGAPYPPPHPAGYRPGGGAGGSSANSSASGSSSTSKSAKVKKKAAPKASSKASAKSKAKAKSKDSKAASTTAKSKAKSTAATKAKRPRSRSSSRSSNTSASTSTSGASPAQQQQVRPPPAIGPPQGYGPVGPPPLQYHEAQLLLGPSMHDMPSCDGGGNGDNRTLEWEAHAEALALGLGLLDDDADDPTCSVTGRTGSHHDAYLQHGPPPAAAEEEEDGGGGDVNVDNDNDGADKSGAGGGANMDADAEAGAKGGSNGKKKGRSDEGSSARADMDVDVDESAEKGGATKEKATRGLALPALEEDDSSLVPILTLHGYRPRSSKAASAGNDVREQFAKAWHGNAAAGSSAGATAPLAKDKTDQEREERRRVQLRERLGRRRTADGDNQERDFREDLAGVWYPRCSWIDADAGTDSTSTGGEGAVGASRSAGAAAVVNPSPPMIRRRQQSQSSAPSAVTAQGRKRSRPAGSVSFSLGGANLTGATGQGTNQSQQQVLQSLPSSSDLLSDPAYIDLVCGSAAKGEACMSLLASLLDAMGMELQAKQRKSAASSRSSLSSDASASVVDSHARPMREGKKPVQTPSTVREFAETLISMGLQQAAPVPTASADTQFTVLDEVAAAFRLACYHVLRYVASALPNSNGSRENKSPVRRKKTTKVSEFARRAYMTLFVTLRGLILRIIDRPDSVESTDVDNSILSFFAATESTREDGNGEASPSFSPLERLLLDVIPLLTRFAHPPLHDKHSTSLMSNLLLLDESTRRKKSKRGKDPTSSTSIIIVRDGLMELFVRQLVDQEDITERRLRKLLNVSSTHLSDAKGAAASLHPKLSNGCILVSEGIVEYRRQQKGELEAFASSQKALPASISTLASATAARSVSSSWDAEDASSGAKANTNTDNDLRLVRIDGCIYLSKIISRLLDSKPKSSSSSPSSSQESSKTESGTNKDSDARRPTSSSASSALSNFAASSELKIKAGEEKLRVNDTEKIEGVAQTAYFLFHTLVESHEADGSFPRENVSSAVLACFLLAGKMEDCPLKLRTILRITKNATLPPPPFETVRQCYDKLAPNAPGVLPMKWGEPSADLIKRYEFSLLTTLGFVMPEDPQSLHPTASIVEIKNKLALDSDTMKHMKRLMKDPCYTHSSLCLLREPQLMAAALYYLSCQKGRTELLKDWDLVLEEEAVVVKVVADYSRWVGHCVKYRERQWNVFKTLKYRVDTKKPGSSATSAPTDGRGNTPDTTVDDSLAVWSRTIPPISEFEAPPLLPMELSAVTEKINGLLSDPKPEESSSPDEVQDEDYLTLAALLEIPDDAVEDSDTSPSANSVDSIAVLMDSRAKETNATCPEDDCAKGGDSGGSKQVDSSETTMVVSPALGDDRHDTVLSEGDANTEAVSDTTGRDATECIKKSTGVALKDGSARPEDSQGAAKSVADDVTNALSSSTIARADVASTVPFSPIRRKSIPSGPSPSECKGLAQKQKVDAEVPVRADESETKESNSANASANISAVVETIHQDDQKSSKEDSAPTPTIESGSAETSSDASKPTLAASDQDKLRCSSHKAASSSTSDDKSAKSSTAMPVSASMGLRAQEAKKEEKSADVISSPVLAAKPAPALPPAPASPKKKLLMKAAEDEAAAEAGAISVANVNNGSATSLSTVNASKVTKPADDIKLPPIVAPKAPSLDASKIAAATNDESSTSPELSTKKKNAAPKAAVTPRRAAAASSLLELKIASKLASTMESISREGSPVPPKDHTSKPPRRATRSAVKAGKSPQPDAKGLGQKSAKKAPTPASRKRRAAAKPSSDIVEQPSDLLEKEEQKKGGSKRAATNRPLKKRALSTSEEPAVPIHSGKTPTGDDAVASVPPEVNDVPLPQVTGTTPSWYPAPNLQRLEAQVKRKGRGKKRAAQEVSTSESKLQEKSVARPTTATKRRKSPRTAIHDASSPKPSSEQEQAKESTSSSVAALSSKDRTPVTSDSSAPSQKGGKKGDKAEAKVKVKVKTAPAQEDLPEVNDDDNFPIASDSDDGQDGSTLAQEQEAERMAMARTRYDFSTDNLKKTAPLYKNDLFRLEDKAEQPLTCDLASLHREAAIHFIDTMKRKPDAFWSNEGVVARAAEAFWFQLPPRVQTEEARHLYRNFADSPDDLRDALALETPDKPLRLRLSRREVDIMLYFVSKGQTAMECYYLMPYRSRRRMREVYESIRLLIGDVKEEYMANVNATVEALIAIEGTDNRKEETQNVIMLC